MSKWRSKPLPRFDFLLSDEFMTSWFTDDAFFPVITGGILAIVFFVFFVMSREKVMLYISVGIALLVGGIFVCEQLIVTEREKIVSIVYDLAFQVRSNDVEGVVSHMSQGRVSLLPGRDKIPGQRRVNLTFEKNAAGVWKVTDYSHSDPREGVRL